VNSYLTEKEVYYEFGIESVLDTVLFYTLNKSNPKGYIKSIVNNIHLAGAKCIVNVLLGAPFLNEDEQKADALNSILKLLGIGVDYIVLFPVNIKPDTLPEVLYKNGMYSRIRAEMLVDVLAEIPERFLPQIDIAWYGEHVEKGVLTPYYCPSCQKGLLDLITDYNAEICMENRKVIVGLMKRMKCNHKSIRNPFFDKSFFERLDDGYGWVRQNVIDNN
jgi:uncharacterized Fe-S cluster-containing MiaB family protein